MVPFLVECYHPGTALGWLDEIRRSIDERGEPSGCHCLTSILVPDDGVAFFVVVGPRLETVVDVMAHVGIVADRVVPSVVAT